MDFSKKILLIDASGEKVKLAFSHNGEVLKEIETSEPAMESLSGAVESLCKDCGVELKEIQEFGLSQGPGSVLGVRIASAYVSTIAKSYGAKIFVWDSLLVGLYALSARLNKDTLTLAVPSRKGFVNVASLENNELKFEKELSLDEAKPIFSQKIFHLRQRAKAELENSQDVNISLAETLKVIKIHNLVEYCSLPPDAKSLTVREYVKWKAQVHI